MKPMSHNQIVSYILDKFQHRGGRNVTKEEAERYASRALDKGIVPQKSRLSEYLHTSHGLVYKW